MIVTINAVASQGSALPNPSTFTLSPGGYSSPSGFTIQTARNVQTRQFLRGKNAKMADRGNRRTTINFSVTRLFDTIPAAESYILLHETTIPGSGTVVFQAVDGKKFYLKDAAVQTTESKQTGRTTMHSYSIMGGVISST